MPRSLSYWLWNSKIFHAILFATLLGIHTQKINEPNPVKSVEYYYDDGDYEEGSELMKIEDKSEVIEFTGAEDYHTHTEIFETYYPTTVTCESFFKSHPKKPGQTDSSGHLKRIHDLMAEYRLDVVILTSRDQHGNLLLYPEDNILYLLTGFSGYSGLAVVMSGFAYLFVRQEWFDRAQFEVDCNWLVQIDNSNDYTTMLTIILKHFKDEEHLKEVRIAADPERFNHVNWALYDTYLKKVTDERCFLVHLPMEFKKALEEELEPEIRPDLTNSIVNSQDQHRPPKWDEFMTKLMPQAVNEKFQVDAYIVSALDEIAWILDLYGKDYEYTSLFKSYLLFVANSYTRLFIDEKKLHETVSDRLKLKERCDDMDINCIKLLSYGSIGKEIINNLSSKRRWLVSTNVNEYIFHTIQSVTEGKAQIFRFDSPIRDKILDSNPWETKAMKDANVEEAKVWAQFVAELESDLLNERRDFDEYKVLELLKYTHRSFHNFTRYGFPPTVITLKNSLIHDYTPTEYFNEPIDKNTLFMVKSGVHYGRGTALLTRIFQFGNIPPLHREIYTALVRCFLVFARTTFPKGTTDKDLEPLIRAPIYDSKFFSYAKVSAHSIGCNMYAIDNFLQFEFRRPDTIKKATVLKPGMFVFFSPTIDIPNYCSLTLGNVFRVVSTTTKEKEEQGDQKALPKDIYYKFAVITYFPFDPNLLMFEKLEPYELAVLKTFYTKISLSVENHLRQDGKTDISDWIAQQFESTPEVEECYIADLSAKEIEAF